MSIFVAFLVLFVPILLIYGIINFFSFKNWTSVFIALDDEQYFRAAAKLNQAGIHYKTKSPINLNTTPMFGGNRQRQYEIFVKKEDADIASRELHVY